MCRVTEVEVEGDYIGREVQGDGVEMRYVNAEGCRWWSGVLDLNRSCLVWTNWSCAVSFLLSFFWKKIPYVCETLCPRGQI